MALYSVFGATYANLEYFGKHSYYLIAKKKFCSGKILSSSLVGGLTFATMFCVAESMQAKREKDDGYNWMTAGFIGGCMGGALERLIHDTKKPSPRCLARSGLISGITSGVICGSLYHFVKDS